MNWETAKKQVAARDENCIRCGGIGTDVHHRKVRGMGGTKNEEVAYGLANLVLLCRECHNWAHQNPATAYESGYMVHSWDNPEEVGVWLGVNRVMFFKSDGTTELIGMCDPKLF